jgi:hypothetical protein
MNVKKHIVRMFAAAAVSCGFSVLAHAQLGSGWTADGETYIEQTSSGCTITPINGGFEFSVPSGQGRAEQRGNNLPTTTTNQWQGFATLKSFPSGSNNICVHQVFGPAPSTPDLILDEATGGPTGIEIMSLEQGKAFEAGIMLNVQFQLNTIYDPGHSLIYIYVNGSQTGTKTPNSGVHYNKFGQYVSLSGSGPATMDWVNVQSWAGGVPPNPNGTQTVATPTFSPAGGSFTSAQSVSISDSTSGATIYYTTNGSTPTTSSTVYGGPISVGSGTVTIEALGAKSGDNNSSVASATYTITTAQQQVATPTFSPAGGSFTSAQSVSISDSTSGATIYYTTNGSTPTTASTVYSGPISVSSGTVTINALGAKSGDTNSSIASATYTISTGGGGCETSGSTWTTFATGSVSGTFTATFDATPHASGITAFIGMTNGAQTSKSSAPWLVKFHSTGDLEALNGSTYASQNTINWVSGSTYHFRVVVNLSGGTYSVYVTPPGQTEQTLATNYAFQASASSLNYWGEQDTASSLVTCNFAD